MSEASPSPSSDLPVLSPARLEGLPPLPADTVRENVVSVFRNGDVLLLEAPPGTGKSSRVPLWAAAALPGRVILLEPRRLAARMLADHLSRLLGTPLGGEVGVAMRHGSKYGPKTKILVVTEGVFTRMACADIFLEGVSCVLFDEFHERHLASDTGLALALHARANVRPDLRVGVLSATLDTESLLSLVPDAAVVRADRPGFPVRVDHLPPPAGLTRADVLRRLPELAAAAVLEAVRKERGSVLVFLPGAGEIRRVETLLLDPANRLPGDCLVRPLHGTLSLDEQRAAIACAEPGTRKIVLATDIAETSLTIEGVRVVVDAGWQRRPARDPGRGATRLVTVRIPLSSAEQRKGRAGRLEEGVCLRLWSRESENAFPRHARPEILDSDLVELALTLALIHEKAADLPFVTPPPQGVLAGAEQTLRDLGLVDADGQVTRAGTLASTRGLGARTAAVVAALAERRKSAGKSGESDRGEQGGSGRTAPTDADVRLACLACAFLEEGDRSGRRLEGDLHRALERFLNDPANAGAARDVCATADRLARPVLHSSEGRQPSGDSSSSRTPSIRELVRTLRPSALGALLLPGYADRLALFRRRGTGRLPGVRQGTGRDSVLFGTLVSGAGVALPLDEASACGLAEGSCCLVLDMDLGTDAARTDGVSGTHARASLFVPVEEGDVRALLSSRFTSDRVLEVDAAGVVRLRVRTLLGALEVECREEKPTADERAQALCANLAGDNLSRLPLTSAGRKELDTFLARVRLARRTLGDPWPELDRDILARRAGEWLPLCVGNVAGVSDVEEGNVLAAVRGLLPWPLPRELDRVCPKTWTSPCGRTHPVDYSGERPRVDLKLQECFGLLETPVLPCGEPLSLGLLSPGGVNLAVVSDLPHFWKETYPHVRAEMRGRYPRHPWPEDPLAASPTALTQKQLRRQEQAAGGTTTQGSGGRRRGGR